MAQTIDHRDLLSAYRPGDLPASERIVRAYQNEVVRSAFLLTGTADGAIRLARNAFLGLFRELMRGKTDEDARYAVLRSLGLRYLAGEFAFDIDDNGAGAAAALTGTVPFDVEPGRFRVDDERSRVLRALDPLDRSTRLGLVLREFNALDEEPVCQILDEIPFTLRERLQAARTKVRDASGAGDDRPVSDLLARAATSAPRPNLWPEVVGPLEDLHAEEDERRQRYTYVVAGLAGLLLFVAGLWLFEVFPFGRGGDSADDPAAAVAPEPTPTETPEPTPTPVPVPDLASFAIPQGDVPARIVMEVRGNLNGGAVRQGGLYDPAGGQFAPYGIDPFGTPSPDGRFIIGVAYPEDTFSVTRRVAAFDASTGERIWRWERSIGTGQIPLAVTLDRIYVVAGDLILRALDLETGEQVGEWPDLIPDLLTDRGTFPRVALQASPDGERLFVAVDEFGTGSSTMWARTLSSYQLSEMTFESSSVQSDSTSDRQFVVDFSFRTARVTPDGAYLYNVDGDLIRFRSSGLAEDLDLELPFSAPISASQQSNLRWTTSNDGRYLYVVALEQGEAVIVDLLARQVARSFALDVSAVGAPLGPAAEVIGPRVGDPPGVERGTGTALSPDGRFLYVVGDIRGVDFTGLSPQAATTIWVIDLASWSVIEGLSVPGAAHHVAHLNGNLVVSVSVTFEGIIGTSTSRIIVLDPVSGAILEELSNEGLPEWASGYWAISLPELYRAVYGRAPAVDQVVPSDVEPESTLPRIDLRASPGLLPAGATLDLDARVLNPAGGRRLAEPDPNVRFDLDATAVIRLTHDDGAAEDVILIANRVDPGRYRASAGLAEAGHWSAEIAFTGADGESWVVSLPKVVQVVPSFEATDGRRYFLSVSADPAEPPAGEDVEIRAMFIDAESGEPLPLEVALLDGAPDEVRVAFTSAGDGVTTKTLARNEEGVYEGDAFFWAPGVWEARVEIRFNADTRVTVNAGAVRVTRG